MVSDLHLPPPPRVFVRRTMKNERLARSRSPPGKALLNCSSDLSCLEPRINREAINLSSRGEWEEGLGGGEPQQSPLPWTSLQLSTPNPTPSLSAQGTHSLGQVGARGMLRVGSWGLSLLASLQVLLMTLIKSNYVVGGYITTPSQGICVDHRGSLPSMKAQDPRAGQITPEGCADRMERAQGVPGKPGHWVDPEASSSSKGLPAFCCSVAPSCSILCNPIDCSMPGFPVLHHLPEFAQTHDRQVGDAIQPPHPLSPSSAGP